MDTETKIPEVSIVIPVCGEADDLAVLFDELRPAVARLERPAEVIFAVSPRGDRSLEFALAYRTVWPSRTTVAELDGAPARRSAMLAGMALARGEIVIVVRPDARDLADELPRLADAIAGGAEMTAGSDVRIGAATKIASRLLGPELARRAGLRAGGPQTRAYSREAAARAADGASLPTARNLYQPEPATLSASEDRPKCIHARPRVALLAYSEPGAACLEELIACGANVAAVFTHDDDPGENIWFRSVREIATRAGIPAHTSLSVEALREAAPDIILCCYYRAMIPAEALEIPRLGAYNIHGSLLPKYRGRAPINWAVINGETEGGATLHAMTREADRGGIVAQIAFPIAVDDTALDVFMKVASAARQLTRDNLAAIERGSAPMMPQDESEATYFGRRTPEDGRIDWSKSAREIYNLVRGVTRPFPGAFTELDGRKAMVWRARAIDREAGPAAGEILSRDPLVIAARSGALEILEWEYADK